MAEFVIKNSKILIDGFDLSCKMNSITVNNSVELKDRTNFCSSARQRALGLFSLEITGSGYFDGSTADLTGDKLWSDIGSTDQIWTLIPRGTGLRNIAYSALKLCSEFSPSGTIGEMYGWNFACYGVGALIRQQLAKAGTFSTSAALTTGISIGAHTTQQLLYATLHATRGATSDGQAVLLKIQTASSSSFGTPTTALKFTSVSTSGGNTAQWKTTYLPSTHTWARVRINSSGSTDGSITGYVTLGIR